MHWLANDAEAFTELGDFCFVACHHEHHHRFTDNSAKAEHDGGDDAGHGGGQNDFDSGLEFGRSHGK